MTAVGALDPFSNLRRAGPPGGRRHRDPRGDPRGDPHKGPRGGPSTHTLLAALLCDIDAELGRTEHRVATDMIQQQSECHDAARCLQETVAELRADIADLVDTAPTLGPCYTVATSDLVLKDHYMWYYSTVHNGGDAVPSEHDILWMFDHRDLGAQ